MSRGAAPRERLRRRTLARVAMTETLLAQLHERGRLHVVFSNEAFSSTVSSLDGSGAVLFFGASGKPVQLLLEDLVDPEDDREVQFPTLTLSIQWRDEELLVHAVAALGAVDPWSHAPTPPRVVLHGDT